MLNDNKTGLTELFEKRQAIKDKRKRKKMKLHGKKVFELKKIINKRGTP